MESDLRRFKQLIEIGEVVLSDASIHRGPHPARPSKAEAETKPETAICGSDLHLYNGFVPSMEKGDVLGHEFMGEVMEIGADVKKVKVGDRVVVPFPISCGHCFMCKQQLFACCENSNPNAWMAEKL